MVDKAMPTAFTGTIAPSKTLHRSGVINMADTVVAVVMTTESATFPFAMNVHRFEA